MQAPAAAAQKVGINRSVAQVLLTGAVLLLIILALWSPVGWNVTPTNENWRNRAIVEGYTSRRIEEKFLAEWQSRPFMLIAPSISHHLSPDASIGFNLVQASLFLAKGLILFLLMRRLLPEHVLLAFFVSILFVVYPADEGTMTLRSIVIHAAAFFYLLATYLLLLYWDHPHPLILAALLGGLALSFGTYEVAYPVWALTPLLLLWKEKRLSGRVVRVSLLWYSIPTIFLLNTLLSFTLPGSKQMRNLTTGMSETSGAFFDGFFSNLVTVYERHFITGWSVGIQSLLHNPRALLVTGIIAILTFATAVVIWQTSPRTQPRFRFYALLIGIGIALILLLTLIYFFTSRIDHEWRVYLFSSVGGALVLTVIVYSLCQQRHALFSAIMSGIVALAFVRNLDQHTLFTDEARQVQREFSEILTVIPQLNEPAYLLFISDLPRDHISNSELRSPGSGMDEAFSLFYDNPSADVLDVEGCYKPNVTCEFLPEGIRVTDREGSYLFPYDQTIVLEVGETLTIVPELRESADYSPIRLIDIAAPLPPRLSSYFP